jgi:hypothetical protein
MTIATPLSDWAHRLLAAHGPFASVYYDDSHDEPDADVRLGAQWQDIARELQHHGADPTLVSVVERAVLHTRPRVGRSGHGLIATADGVLVDEHLDLSPPSTTIRVSGLPYVLPLLGCGPPTPTYLVVAIDKIGADLSLHQGKTVRTETIAGDGFPVHEEAAGTHGWGDQQHRVEEAIRRNVRAVANALTDAYDHDTPEVVFVIGQDRIRAELKSFLPERIRTRIIRPRVGARHTGVDDTVRQAITLEFENRRRVASDYSAQRFRTEAGRRSGLAVEGLSAVCSALRADAVATLLLGDLTNEIVIAGERPTMVATDADALSAFGVPPTRTLLADEAIPFAAMASGADLVHVGDGLNPRDGVAALLRYPGGAPFESSLEGSANSKEGRKR